MISNEIVEEILSRPWKKTVELMSNLEGDIAVLGIGGKMGPTLGRMLVRAIEQSGTTKKIIGVSRFSDKKLRDKLEHWGIESHSVDLLQKNEVKKIPVCRNVIFMAGRKFGEIGTEALTWAFNTIMPSNVCEHFQNSKMVVFSTGCVYPLWDSQSTGPVESDNAEPQGEYANSCVGRERIFEYYTMQQENSSCLKLRLNYSVEPRYGILYELATNIYNGESVSLSMPCVNIIWQGDANNAAILSLAHTKNPPNILNVTGHKLLTKELAERIAFHLDLKVEFRDIESSTALLSNNRKMLDLLKPEFTPLEEMIKLTVQWVREQGKSSSINPTHFQVRDGKFLDSKHQETK